MAHPAIRVKPLVGALAYIYGVTLNQTYSAVSMISLLERHRFMQETMVRFRLHESGAVK